ncbi:MAG: hypothetical protein ACK5MQ_18020, partial [Pikeienuella sp.]
MTAGALALSAAPAQAACINAATAGADGGSTCVAGGSSYMSGAGSAIFVDPGSSLTMTANPVTATTTGTAPTAIVSGGELYFRGDVTLAHVGGPPAGFTVLEARLPRALVLAEGALDIITGAPNGDGLRIGSGGVFEARGDTFINVSDEGVVSSTVNSGRADAPGSSMATFRNLDLLSGGAGLRAEGALGNGVIVTGDTVSIGTLNPGGHGVAAFNGGDVIINTAGGAAVGDGNSNIVLATPNTLVETQGDNAHGLVARTRLGDARVEMSAGRVVTGAAGPAANAEGVFALVNGGTGNASILFSGGEVETGGSNAEGLIANVSDGMASTRINGSAEITITGGDIFVTGPGSAGAVAQTDISVLTPSTGAARITQSGGSIRTRGDVSSAYQGGYGALSLAPGSGEASFTQTGGIIDTTGQASHGAYVVSFHGPARVMQGENGRIEATGVDASGVFAVAGAVDASSPFDIDLAGVVAGGTGAGAGVETMGVAGSLDLASTARLSALSGVAIVDGDGEIAITSHGAIDGDVRTRLGNDTFSLLDGSIQGAVDMGEGSDLTTVAGAVDVGSSSFNGGDDVGTADMFEDVLTFSGGARSFDGASLTHWERVVLDDGVDFRLGGALLTGA